MAPIFEALALNRHLRKLSCQNKGAGWPVSMDPRGRSGPSMAQLHKWVAEHGSTTSRNNGAEEAGEIQSKLVDRFTARVSIAMHRTLMHAYHDRWLRVRARWEQESGQSAVSALELRFQGSGRV